MVTVGKYRSRRRRGGKLNVKIVSDHLSKAIETAKDAVSHPMDHEPMEILKTVEKQAPSVAAKLLNEHVRGDVQTITPMRSLTSEFPNFGGPDPFAYARSLREKFKFDALPRANHERVGGNIFKEAFSTVKKATESLNPAHSVGSAFDSLDRIHLQDTSLRGISKNALHARSAFLHANAAYAQTTGLMLAPVTGGASVAGLGGVGMATNKIADAHETMARRI